MGKSRAYRATQVKSVCVDRIVSGRGGAAAYLGLDVGKETVLCSLRWGPSDFERPWKVANPLEIRDLMKVLLELNEDRELIVALEPTGTYGDPLRQAMADAGLAVHRVSPKASHDYAEIFDGVPSQHDGKDAAIVAELAALGKSSPWEFLVPAWTRELAYWVDRLELQRRQLATWYGRLEGLLARHWPEATRTLRLSGTVLLRCLAEYGGPSGLSSDPGAVDRLKRWGRGQLAVDKVAELVASARKSVGVRQGEFDVRRMRDYAEAALAVRAESARCKKELGRLSANHEVIQAQAAAVGVVTACVLWMHLGDPHGYDSAESYRKGMGLNLKEHSSGKWVGQVKITKRGPSEVRRWLYLSALRFIREKKIHAWYESQINRRAGDRAAKMRAVVGVMRKLALALYHVGVGDSAFDAAKLFPAAPAPDGGPAAKRPCPSKTRRKLQRT